MRQCWIPGLSCIAASLEIEAALIGVYLGLFQDLEQALLLGLRQRIGIEVGIRLSSLLILVTV